jgi:hypothetical protein
MEETALQELSSSACCRLGPPPGSEEGLQEVLAKSWASLKGIRLSGQRVSISR